MSSASPHHSSRLFALGSTSRDGLSPALSREPTATAPAPATIVAASTARAAAGGTRASQPRRSRGARSHSAATDCDDGADDDDDAEHSAVGNAVARAPVRTRRAPAA